MSRLFQLAKRAFRESPIPAELRQAARGVKQAASGGVSKMVDRELSKYGMSRAVRASVLGVAKELGLSNWLRRAVKAIGGSSGGAVKQIVDAITGVADGKTRTRTRLRRQLNDAVMPPPVAPQDTAGTIPPLQPWDTWSPPEVVLPPIVPRPPLGKVPPVLPPKPPQSPPAIPPSLPPPPPPNDGDGDDEFPGEHGVDLLGRGSIGYHVGDTQRLIEREILTPGSSNVYSFVFEHESRTRGILYVTFKAWHPGQHGSRPNVAGPTYAYYDVPVQKYQEFRRTAASSVGEAVWDYLRVRGKGNFHAHQHPYRLAAATLVPSGGQYVPRKATARGFKNRAIAAHGTGRREFVRSSLPEREYVNRGQPDRGRPDRGTPDSGN